MPQEARSRSKTRLSKYECALQLQEILHKSNITPVMTMVIFEFLEDIIEKRVTIDPTIYEHIEDLFAEKIRLAIYGERAEAIIHAKSKAYLIVLLEITHHANLLTGIGVELQNLRAINQTKVYVKLDPKGVKVTKEGIDFIKAVEEIREKKLQGDSLVGKLEEVTMDRVAAIVNKYMPKVDKEYEDVIVIDTVQA